MFRNTIAAAALLSLLSIVVASPVMAGVPRTIIAENFGATW